MTTDIRTFRAENLQSALEIVRQEMGHDAVVLHTRQIEKRRWLPFLSTRQEVEITAGKGHGVRPQTSHVGDSSTIASRTATIARAKSATADEDLAPPPPLLPERTDSRPSHHGTTPRNTVIPPRWSPDDVIIDRPQSVGSKSYAKTTPSVSKPLGQVGSRSFPTLPSRPKEALPAGHQAETISQSVRQTTFSSSSETDAATIQQRLDTLQRMILELGKERTGSSLHDIPAELFSVYTQLVEAEWDEDQTRELVMQLKLHATRTQLLNPRAMQNLLTALVERQLRIGRPIQATHGQRKIVALVGPTGVGKTTTLAKLAANFRLREGRRVGLITVDTYRIAAVEQLKTYAELIELPMQVVTNPAEMTAALKRFDDLDLVLIDTAGRSPNDDLKIQELRDCLEAAQLDEVHLVLSLTAGWTALQQAAQVFRSVGVTSLIISKLDEVAGLGGLWPAARELQLPISYLTTGQNVPDDIEPAHATRMAKLLLGQESLTR
ncbi:flagellar biosynthesis protein FlhF [bacterium]|nr:flagellar biosynthesis protein FlhF [bacterium]